jgi:hypothetical protein
VFVRRGPKDELPSLSCCAAGPLTTLARPPGPARAAPTASSGKLIEGPCEEVLPALPEGVFDCCITDPPYGLNVAPWDKDVPHADLWEQVRRVMKPS